MGKSLVIVESPAKAKTINKYLGSQYIVKSSVGHIRSLAIDHNNASKDPKEKLISALGFDPYTGRWDAHYVIDAGKRQVVNELKHYAKEADKIYLASDLDREGEAIAWHVKDVLGGDPSKYVRVTFNEITERAIKEAFNNPSMINERMVEAQKTRQFMDKLTGFMVSPVLWSKVQRGLSAGRVQSVATKLIVEKEREIRKFIPDEYWEIKVNTKFNQDNVLLNLTQYKQLSSDKLSRGLVDPVLRNEVTAYLSDKQKPYKVTNVNTSRTTSKPKAPFITSTLQQAASTKLGFNVSRTMRAAQNLYEAGYITYMRTDSVNISEDALKMVRDYILGEYGQKYLSPQVNRYGNKEGAQAAHECIRPSTMEVKFFEHEDERKLFNLIKAQFLACQMTPAEFDVTTVTVSVNDVAQLKTKGKVVVFDGWTKVMGKANNDEETILPPLKQHDSLAFDKLFTEQKYTKPPARYSEAGLVKELEKRGIGRPSTYASIITTIEKKGYVEIENKQFKATQVGEIVTDRLSVSFPELMDYDNTANLEKQLDDIANGQTPYKPALDKFFLGLEGRCTTAMLPAQQGGMPDNQLKVLDLVKCPKCTRPMVLRHGKSGLFLGCSGYSDKANPCKHNLSLIDDEEGNKESLNSYRCKQCNEVTTNKFIDETHRLHICVNNRCNHVEVEEGQFDLGGHPCNVCNATMKKLKGFFGNYLKCPECGNTRTILADGSIAPPREKPIEFKHLKGPKKGTYFVIYFSSSGNPYMTLNKKTKERIYRNIYLEEFHQVKDKVPQALHYLFTAPLIDEEGNKTFIRQDKRNNRLVVSSLDPTTNKMSKYTYHFEDGVWKLSVFTKKKE